MNQAAPGGGIVVSPPSIVQSVYARIQSSPGTYTITLSQPPTPGNLLMFAVTGKDGDVTWPTGFTEQFYDGSESFQKAAVATRTVLAGDGTSWSYTLPTSGEPTNLALLEIKNASALTFAHCIPSISQAPPPLGGDNSTSNSIGLVLALFESDTRKTMTPTVASAWTINEAFGVSDGYNHVGLLMQANALIGNGVSTTAPSVTWPNFGTNFAVYATTLVVSTATVATAVTSLAVSGSPQLIGDVVLVAGSNVSLTESGQQITIASSAGSLAGDTDVSISSPSNMGTS